MPRRPAAAALAAWCSALAACGSDPASEPAGEPPPAIPDYTRSACYGSSRSTFVYDADTHGTREVRATCRAEGDRALVYVADEIWQVPTESGSGITQREVDGFMAGYELRGTRQSYQPELGVLPTDELVFGALPAGLPDGKLPVFVVDSGGAGEGYLCSWCDGIEFHLDGPLLGSLHSDEALSIAAHETVHVIHRGYDADETVWVDETLAQAAMTVNGFFTDGDWLEDFLDDTNVAWGPGVDDPLEFHYGAGLLFGSYLWERGGRRLLSAIVREPLDDWSGLDAALATSGETSDAWGLYLDMGLSAFLDDPVTGYSFEHFELGGAIVPDEVATGASHAGVVDPYGLVFLTFDGNARSVTLETTASVSSRLVLGEGRGEVVELAPGEPFDVDSAPRVLLLTARGRAPFTVTVL